MFDTPSALIPISFSFRALYIITSPKKQFYLFNYFSVMQ